MTWILLSVAVSVAALAVLAFVVLGLWRRVKALSSTVTTAGEGVAEATDRLTAAQLAGPLGGPQASSVRPPAT